MKFNLKKLSQTNIFLKDYFDDHFKLVAGTDSSLIGVTGGGGATGVTEGVL